MCEGPSNPLPASDTRDKVVQDWRSQRITLREAKEQLYTQSFPRLVQYVKNPRHGWPKLTSKAEDLAQETLILFFESKLGGFVPDGRPHAVGRYLLTVLKGKCNDARKNEERRTKFLRKHSGLFGGQRPNDLHVEVEEVFDKLDPAQADVLRRFHGADQSISLIMKKLSLTRKEVETLLEEGGAQFRKHWGPYY